MPPAQCGLRASAGADSTRLAPQATAAAAAIPRTFTGSSISRQAIAVYREYPADTEKPGRLARGHHAGHEDLEVLHHLGDLGVDRQLERDLLPGLVHVQEALLDRVVHSVVNVELDHVVIVPPC